MGVFRLRTLLWMCWPIGELALSADGRRMDFLREQRDVHESIETQDPGYLHFPVWILDRSTSEVLTFNPSRGESATVSFRLTRPARVRVRLVRRDQPSLLVRTLVDWRSLELGQHKIQWDGRDASGNLTDNRKILVVFQGDREHDGGIDHFRHEPQNCHDLQVAISSSKGTRRVESRSGAIYGLKVQLADRPEGAQRRYHLRAFLDWTPWIGPVMIENARWFPLPEPRALGSGEHVIAVNVDDGNDHVGAATITLFIP